MTMYDSSVIKGTAADVKGSFFSKLLGTFPVQNAGWKKGETIEDVAFKAGQQSIIDWIKAHASISS
jgi:hypothetical protein